MSVSRRHGLPISLSSSLEPGGTGSRIWHLRHCIKSGLIPFTPFTIEKAELSVCKCAWQAGTMSLNVPENLVFVTGVVLGNSRRPTCLSKNDLGPFRSSPLSIMYGYPTTPDDYPTLRSRLSMTSSGSMLSDMSRQ